MDSLNSILLDKNFDQPQEITAIKAYVQRHFQCDVGVKLAPQAIIITAQNAALAGSLRMHIHQLQSVAATDKKLVLRIGK